MREKEIPKRNERPEQRRMRQADDHFSLSVSLHGFTGPLAAKHISRWASAGAEQDGLDSTTWKKLSDYAQAEGTRSYSEIMGAAIEKRLLAKASTENTPLRENQVKRTQALLERPEFSGDQNTYSDLNTLYEEYSAIARRYDPNIATHYWLLTRTVNPNLAGEVDSILQSEALPPSKGSSFFENTSHYLLNRLNTENDRARSPEQGFSTEATIVNERVGFASIDDLYQEFKRREKEFQTARDMRNWLETLAITLSEEERTEINRFTGKMKHIDGSQYSGKTELLRRFLLDKRKREPQNESQEHRKRLAEEREKIQQAPPPKPAPRERSNESLVTEAYMNELLPGILELITHEDPEDSLASSRIIRQVAEQEFPRAPIEVKNRYESIANSSQRGLSAIDHFSARLTILVGEKMPRKKKEKPKSFWKKLWPFGN